MDDRDSKYTYPLVYNVDETENEKTDVLKYITCVWTDQTLSKDDVRLRPKYTFTVRAYKGKMYKDYELELDVRRSVLELLHPGVN